MEQRKQVIDNLIEIMGRCDLTYGDLAKQIGISRMTLHNFMKYGPMPQIRNEYKIMNYIKRQQESR